MVVEAYVNQKRPLISRTCAAVAISLENHCACSAQKVLVVHCTCFHPRDCTRYEKVIKIKKLLRNLGTLLTGVNSNFVVVSAI